MKNIDAYNKKENRYDTFNVSDKFISEIEEKGISSFYYFNSELKVAREYKFTLRKEKFFVSVKDITYKKYLSIINQKDEVN
jgi:hypothetical protein